MIKDKPLTTDLIGDKTVKTDEKIEFFGQVDELSSFIMEFTHYVQDVSVKEYLKTIVKTLSGMMAEVAGGKTCIDQTVVKELTDIVSDYLEKSGGFNSFCLPGETLLGAKAHILRTIARRTERAYARVYQKYGGSNCIFEYLNKLSTYFYALAKQLDSQK